MVVAAGLTDVNFALSFWTALTFLITRSLAEGVRAMPSDTNVELVGASSESRSQGRDS